MISRSFQTVRLMREAWKWETCVRSQSFSSESAVKYLNVGRRKIQISRPLGEQDQSNDPTLGSTKAIKSPPHALPPPPRRHNIDRCTRMLQKFFSSVLSIYTALCKSVSLAIFQAVKLFWLPSEKREIDLYISTWAFSCSFPVCLALLMSVYFTTSDKKWKTKMMFWGKKSSQDLQEDFFQKVLTDQSLVVSRFLVCSQSPVFP